ncbi:MAG TPA: hypothetical protein VFD35_14060 [Pricia sp.]|nr:hypothetical protein [Pricia sp.]
MLNRKRFTDPMCSLTDTTALNTRENVIADALKKNSTDLFAFFLFLTPWI